MVKEVASKTAEVAGDGTTTATVLAQIIYSEGAKLVAAGANPMDLKRGIEAAVIAVVEHLKQQSRATGAREEIAQVGRISSNGDETIGDLLAEAMEKVGKDGVITDRGSQVDRDNLGAGRRLTVRSRLCVSLFRDRSRAHGVCAQRRLHSALRETHLEHEGFIAAPGAGCAR